MSDIPLLDANGRGWSSSLIDQWETIFSRTGDLPGTAKYKFKGNADVKSDIIADIEMRVIIDEGEASEEIIAHADMPYTSTSQVIQFGCYWKDEYEGGSHTLAVQCYPKTGQTITMEEGCIGVTKE